MTLLFLVFYLSIPAAPIFAAFTLVQSTCTSLSKYGMSVIPYHGALTATYADSRIKLSGCGEIIWGAALRSMAHRRATRFLCI